MCPIRNRCVTTILCQIAFFIINSGLCQDITVSSAEGTEMAVDSSIDENLISPQCRSQELRLLSNKYEICHRINIEKIEQKFDKPSDRG